MAFDSKPPSEWNLQGLSRLVTDAEVDLSTLAHVHGLTYIHKKEIKRHDLAAYNSVILARAQHLAPQKARLKEKLKELYALYQNKPHELLAQENLDGLLGLNEFPQIIVSTPERSAHLARIHGDLFIQSLPLEDDPDVFRHLAFACNPIDHALVFASRGIMEKQYRDAGFTPYTGNPELVNLVASAPHLQDRTYLIGDLNRFKAKKPRGIFF